MASPSAVAEDISTLIQATPYSYDYSEKKFLNGVYATIKIRSESPKRECRDIETIDSGTARRKTFRYLVTFPSKNDIWVATEMQSML